MGVGGFARLWSDVDLFSASLAYAEWLLVCFATMSEQSTNTSTALRAGSQALVYCVQAKDWELLGGFAGQLITAVSNSEQLAALLPHLHTAAEAAPAGELRWLCLCYLADALRCRGQPDSSLPYYEQAAFQAHAAAEAGGDGAQKAWADLGAIKGNWANALRDSGKLDIARQRHLESVKAKKQAGCSAVNVVGSELEALRIDIMQGRADMVRSEVEARLMQVQQWWARHLAGQPVPEAPDAKMLTRVFTGALDIARQADYAREDWLSALRHLDDTLEVQNILQRPVEDIGVTRFNRANVLLRLSGRIDEARAELEACFVLFQNNSSIRAKVLSALADLFDEQNDISEAVTQQLRALALCNTLPSPASRAISHSNLAIYIAKLNPSSDFAEASHHRLAALVYRLVAGLGLHLQTSLSNYANVFRRAQTTGTAPAIPRVAELLADPAFAPLVAWLSERKVDVATLQIEIDTLLEQVRQYVMQNQ